MNIQKIPADTLVRPTAMPVFLEGGSTACLLIHGFTGYPGEMLYLGNRLHKAGYTVCIPRLPGHGTNTGDFLQVKGDDWLRRCTDTYLELAVRYERVYICGLSLGGILATLLTGRFEPDGCVLYAPGLAVVNRIFHLTPFLKFFIRRLSAEYREQSDDPDRLYLAEEYWRWRYAAPIAEVRRLQKKALKALGDIGCDTLVFVSEADKTVPARAADIVAEKIGRREGLEIIRLEKSSHVVVNDCEREWVADSTIAWMENRQKGDVHG